MHINLWMKISCMNFLLPHLPIISFEKGKNGKIFCKIYKSNKKKTTKFLLKCRPTKATITFSSSSNSRSKKKYIVQHNVFRLYFLRPRLMKGSSPFTLLTFSVVIRIPCTCFNYIIRLFLWTISTPHDEFDGVDGHEIKFFFAFLISTIKWNYAWIC